MSLFTISKIITFVGGFGYTAGLLKKRGVIKALVLSFATITHANEVEITDVRVKCSEQICDFAVTVKHRDEGWQHYANEWHMKLSDGSVLGTRVLLHPHVDEQPFTRSLPGVRMPMGTQQVEICGHDSVHGWSKPCHVVRLPEQLKSPSYDARPDKKLTPDNGER